MSHVYQPLMLMELLGRRSPAPAQDVARRILGEDVTQIEVYTERVKRMVGKVHLQRHHPLRAGDLRPGGGEARGESASPRGCLEPLGTSETQCLAVARERTAMRS